MIYKLPFDVLDNLGTGTLICAVIFALLFWYACYKDAPTSIGLFIGAIAEICLVVMIVCSVATATYPTCANCGEKVNTDYCTHCGEVVKENITLICPGCGAECDTPYCGECGIQTVKEVQ